MKTRKGRMPLKLNKQSLSKIGDKNPQWKGDDVSYGKLHDWVATRLPKTMCNDCKVKESYDLANKGIYNRELKNWEWLCRQCHMKKDGRLDVFLSFRKPLKKGNEIWKLVKNRPKGESHKKSKLTEKKVLEIRKLYKTKKYTLDDLGKKYGVCFQSISMVVNRKIWTHI
jgi:hypothetical protein